MNPITCEATAVHGLTNSDVAGRSFDLAAIDRILDPARSILTWAPRFDGGMFDTMRLQTKDRPWHQMRVVEGSHPPRPSGPGPGISRARARVEHMIDCLTRPDPRWPVRPWLESVLEMPALEALPEYQLEGNAVFGEIIHRNLGDSALGARFTLWTKPEVDFINAYDRSGPHGGPGLIFRLQKSRNRKLAKYMAEGGWVEGVLVEIDGMRRRVEIDYAHEFRPAALSIARTGSSWLIRTFRSCRPGRHERLTQGAGASCLPGAPRAGRPSRPSCCRPSCCSAAAAIAARVTRGRKGQAPAARCRPCRSRSSRRAWRACR